MNRPKSHCATFVALAAASILAGCAGIGSRTPVVGANPPAAIFHHGLIPGSVSFQPDNRPSWISPDGKKGPTLWVDDFSAGDIDIFTLPRLKLSGTITRLTYPNGMCADRKGNVWVVTTGSNPITYEYSHAGKRIGRIRDMSGYPGACAYDPTTEDLAISNFEDFSSGSGFVQIYKHGRGKPRVYSGGNIFEYYLVAYDSSGNLFANGCSVTACAYGGKFQLAELPKGGSSFHPVSVSGGTIHFPASILWDPTQNDLIAADPECGGVVYSTCLYRISVSGSSGTITGSMTLRNATGGTACYAAQLVLTRSGKLFAGGDYEPSASECPSFTTSGTYLWSSRTGKPAKSNLAEGQIIPNGGAISY